MTGLPESWQDVQIIDVLENNENGRPFQQGWSPQCESFSAPEGAWGVLKTTAIQHGEFWPHENKALPDTLEPRPQTEVKPGDVLMTCAGPRNRCGVACLVENTRSRLMMSGKMYRFRPHPEALHPKYLAYLIRRQETQLEIDRMKTGINDSGLNLTHDRFSQLRLPLPPLPEQHRIVAKIEELFSELDAGTASLTRARAQLKTYRQALLKAAFEGKLTAPWRAANPDKLKSPETLLSRIRTERDTRHAAALDDWQTALSEWRAGGEVGRKPGKPSRPSDIPAEKDIIADLGDGWLRIPLGLLVDDPAYGTSKKCNYDAAGVGVLRIPNIAAGTIDAGDLKYAEFDEAEREAYRLLPGDLLTIRSNGSISLVGKTAVIGDAHAEYVFAGYLIRLRPNLAIVEPRYLLRVLESHDLRKQIEGKAKSTSGVNNINSGELQELAVPFCRLDEQNEVVTVLDAKLSSVDAIESEITTALTRISALRQSILKKAFSGQLVPQDPADEPASALLARLAQAPAPKPRRKTAK